MSVDAATLKDLLTAVSRAVIDHADELTALDRAIGDGDHGLNMKRGFEAVLADCDAICAKPLPDALKALGTTLVMKVGGASGPLYGTLFMTLGKSLLPQPTRADAVSAFGAAIDAIKRLGKSDVGMKTMLDVLVPVHAALAQGEGALAVELPRRAAEAAQATIAMRAVRGRASFLGERSIGHMDPGARSSELMVAAVCAVLDGRTQ